MRNVQFKQAFPPRPPLECMIVGNSIPMVLFYSAPAARKSREGQGRVGEDPGNEIESQGGCVEEIRGRFVREQLRYNLRQIITCNIWIKQLSFYFLNNSSTNNNNNTLNS